jgi:hypothetical protein
VLGDEGQRFVELRPLHCAYFGLGIRFLLRNREKVPTIFPSHYIFYTKVATGFVLVF